MANLTKLGNLYGRLCGELAAALAHRVTRREDWMPIDTPPAGTKGALFYHYSQSAFEATAGALTSFGLFAAVRRDDKPGETLFCQHALTMDAAEMPAHLANSVLDGDDRLSDLLEAFLAVFCEYDYLPDRHTFFTPPDYLTSAMSMLARTGYAEKAGDQFRWTEKVGPAMKAAYVWDENSASFSETNEKEIEANAQLAWLTMPETLRTTIRSGKASVLDVTKILALGWRDGRWHAFRLDDPVVLGHNELPVARRLFAIAEGEK